MSFGPSFSFVTFVFPPCASCPKKVTEYTKIFTENTEILQNDVLWPSVSLCDLHVQKFVNS